MAITSSETKGVERVKVATGSHLDSAGTDAAVIVLGFMPREVVVQDQTTHAMFVWTEGMASPAAIRTVAAGTRSAITTGGITIGVDGRSFSFPVLTNSQYRWKATS